MTIKQFENDNSYNHNKGIVYANLGIAQDAQKRIDEGFVNILKALDEDREYLEKGRNPAQEFFNSKLFKEKMIIRSPLENQITHLRIEGEACPNAEEFLNGLSDPI